MHFTGLDGNNNGDAVSLSYLESSLREYQQVNMLS